MNFYTDGRNTNTSKVGHTHDERYYTEAEITTKFKEHFYGTAIIDASTTQNHTNYQFAPDNTYIVTCTKGTNENETAVWILNTRNNLIIVTTLKSVSGISYLTNKMTFGVYCDKGIIGESCCFKMS